MSFLHDFDSRYSGVVCGIDEAGRGCLAGDVFAAAVILGTQTQIQGLDDSKKLTAVKREKLYDEIILKCDAYAIATASVEEIEDMNILNATLVSMKRAYVQVTDSMAPNVILIDGNKAPHLPVSSGEIHATVLTVIGGDAKSASIAAASILAKVARDRYMQELDKLYPQYQFAKHKGYGTKLHNEMILKHGISPIHRMSFLKKILSREK